MKSKLVLWGNNAQDEKCLIAVSLRAAENKVDIWTFPESVATEDFYQKMMKEWRDGSGMELTDATTHIERDLSISESVLPDDLKVERGDVVQRAQSEWHFAVLSSKLNESYENQLSELKERVGKLESFDQPTWDKLKEFWDKVQEQVRDRNLFRDHADRLRNNLNELFGEMKTMRSKLDDEFQSLSKEAHDKFFAALDEVERKMESGARVPVLFDELRKLQSMFRESKTLTREHRNKVWDKLDGTFKAVKQKRFGGKPGGGDPNAKGGGSMLQGTQHRLDGLLAAIDKMEQSIRRDRNDLEFQTHKINTTDGQLEAQIRQAKLKMIEERVHSKEEKLNEMTATKVELEKRIGSLKEKEARRAAQEAAKEKIVGEIKAAAEAREDVSEKLDKAAEEISTAKSKKAPKAATTEEPVAAEEAATTAEEPTAEEAPKAEAPKTESILGAVGTIMGESFDDIVDTVKAVASVIGDKIEEAIEEMKEDFKEATSPETEPTAASAAEETPAAAEEVAPANEEAVASEEPVATEETPAAEEPASEKKEEA